MLPIVIGVAVFLVVVGHRSLDPANIGWLRQDDPATAYLGWATYRSAEWALPIGLNPGYGLELSSSVVYSDSIPLLAILFKTLDPVLPETFQYFGLWLLACFALQGWCSWRLAALATDHTGCRVLIILLFLLAPPMLWRLHGHFALVAHFLVLAALYLALAPREHRLRGAWAAVLVTSSLVHAYLLAMTAALWIGHLIDRAISRESRFRNLARDATVAVGLVSLAMWLAGYFTVSGGLGAGYGIFRMNPLSIVDPSGWSHVLNDLPEGPGDYEGFNFLGLGALFLVLSAIPGGIAQLPRLKAAINRRRGLMWVLLGLSAFAISNDVSIGSNYLTVPLPESLQAAAGTFRASGRMFWPVFYALLFTAAWIVCRAYERRIALILLLAASILQFMDTSAGWLPLRSALMREPASQLAPPLRDDFWKQAAERYKKLVYLPPGNKPAHWQAIADYASKHRLSTNAVYLARIDDAALIRSLEDANRAVTTGEYSVDTLYVVGDSYLLSAVASIDANSDLLATVDGLAVIAPGWKMCATCKSVQTELRLSKLLHSRTSEGRFQLGTSAEGNAFLASGWSKPEDWGVWSNSSRAEILLQSHENLRSVALEGSAFLAPPTLLEQRIAISVNGVHVQDAIIRQREHNFIHIAIPEAVRRDAERSPVLRISLAFGNATRPYDVGVSADRRSLAIGLRAISLSSSVQDDNERPTKERR